MREDRLRRDGKWLLSIRLDLFNIKEAENNLDGLMF